MARIKLYSWNVNGIRAVARKELFQPFLNTEKPDILCIQETKAKPEQIDVDIDGYDAFWYSAEKPGYSGTGLLAKPKPLQVINGFPQDIIKKFKVSGDTYGDPNAEGRVIAAEFDKFWVVTVYTPNAKDDLSRIPLRHKHWDPAFLAYCQQLEKSKPVVFCGDLNVAHTPDDLANDKANVGKKGFTDEERGRLPGLRGCRFCGHPYECSNRAKATTPGGHTSPRPANATSAGALITCWFRPALKDKVKAAAIHPASDGLRPLPGICYTGAMSQESKGDAETTLQELKDLVHKFEQERGWAKHHNPKNVAISLCIEAAELLEHFQWDEYRQEDKQAIADELADVIFNCLNFANQMDIDISAAFMNKFERIQKKYPVEKFLTRTMIARKNISVSRKAYRQKDK